MKNFNFLSLVLVVSCFFPLNCLRGKLASGCPELISLRMLNLKQYATAEKLLLMLDKFVVKYNFSCSTTMWYS